MHRAFAIPLVEDVPDPQAINLLFVLVVPLKFKVRRPHASGIPGEEVGDLVALDLASWNPLELNLNTLGTDVVRDADYLPQKVSAPVMRARRSRLAPAVGADGVDDTEIVCVDGDDTFVLVCADRGVSTLQGHEDGLHLGASDGAGVTPAVRLWAALAPVNLNLVRPFPTTIGQGSAPDYSRCGVIALGTTLGLGAEVVGASHRRVCPKNGAFVGVAAEVFVRCFGEGGRTVSLGARVVLRIRGLDLTPEPLDVVVEAERDAAREDGRHGCGGCWWRGAREEEAGQSG